MYAKIKKFYEMGLYSAVQVYKFVEKGIITTEQYNAIVGGREE
jgi:uncharacterized XkdX family phage protein